VLSRNVVFFKRSLGVVITAGALGLGLFMGSAGPGRAQDKQATPPGPNVKDQQEYDISNKALKDTDNKQKLADLNKWKELYPATEFVDIRHELFMDTYAALGMARQAVDEAQEILKTRPLFVKALAQVLQNVLTIKPAPTPADLDAGEKVALKVLDDPAVFGSANKPEGVADAAWTTTGAQIKEYAKKILLNIYLARDVNGPNKDDKRAVDDLTKMLNRDPNMATAAFELGRAMQRIIKATNTPENQPPMFWQFARAISITGANALPAASKTAATTFLTQAYTLFHGSPDGLQDLIAQVKSGPFPPTGFSLKSTVDIAKEQAAADAAEQAKDPLIYLWVHQVKEPLLMDPGLWERMADALLPGPDPDDKSEKPAPRYFNATIISITPATRPKEIVVAIEKSTVADAKLTFETPPPGKMDPGEKIQFQGLAKEFSKEPFMITFKIDDYKLDMNGTWTGKNAAPGRGGATGKGGAANKGTGKAAAK
jgi:hypothetical protein